MLIACTLLALLQPRLTLECPVEHQVFQRCLLYTSPSPRDVEESRMPSSA